MDSKNQVQIISYTMDKRFGAYWNWGEENYYFDVLFKVTVPKNINKEITLLRKMSVFRRKFVAIAFVLKVGNLKDRFRK